MVSSLLAGIHAPLVNGREGLMPESLTRRANAADVSGGCPASFRNHVRLRVGTVSGFARNRVRHRLGISVRLQSDFAPSETKASHIPLLKRHRPGSQISPKPSAAPVSTSRPSAVLDAQTTFSVVLATSSLAALTAGHVQKPQSETVEAVQRIAHRWRI